MFTPSRWLLCLSKKFDIVHNLTFQLRFFCIKLRLVQQKALCGLAFLKCDRELLYFAVHNVSLLPLGWLFSLAEEKNILYDILLSRIFLLRLQVRARRE